MLYNLKDACTTVTSQFNKITTDVHKISFTIYWGFISKVNKTIVISVEYSQIALVKSSSY